MALTEKQKFNLAIAVVATSAIIFLYSKGVFKFPKAYKMEGVQQRGKLVAIKFSDPKPLLKDIIPLGDTLVGKSAIVRKTKTFDGKHKIVDYWTDENGNLLGIWIEYNKNIGAQYPTVIYDFSGVGKVRIVN